MARPESRVLSDQELVAIIKGRAPIITTKQTEGILQQQVQPSSLDLTLGNRVFGMGMACLPQAKGVTELLEECRQYMFTLDQWQGGFLHRGYTYVIEMNERIFLPKQFSAKFSPKSSVGRSDVFVRVMADGVSRFDRIPEGYQGGLYLEVTPLSFPILIRPNLSLVQMRISDGDARLSGSDIAIEHARYGMFVGQGGAVISAHELCIAEYGVYLHVDLDRDVVGFVARTNVSGVLSFTNGGTNDPIDYWEPIRRPHNGHLILDPGRFYLLATKERVRIPPDLCGDIAPYDASTGEFRTHYAGFFDPGFGGETGVTGVLEVRGREIPHRLLDGDPVCLMVFERVGRVEKPYAGHYQQTGPSLSKYFKNRYEMWS